MYQSIKKINKTNKITIEQLYNIGKEDMGSTLAGHESVDCSNKVLNIKINQDNITRLSNCYKNEVNNVLSCQKTNDHTK